MKNGTTVLVALGAANAWVEGAREKQLFPGQLNARGTVAERQDAS